MSEQVKNIIDALSNGNQDGAGEAFKDALRMKVGDSLEARRKEIANTLFQSKLEADPISDPKPEVADPSPRTEITVPEVKAEPEVEATPEVEVKADEPESK